jgi:hypothetical protein
LPKKYTYLRLPAAGDWRLAGREVRVAGRADLAAVLADREPPPADRFAFVDFRASFFAMSSAYSVCGMISEMSAR